MKWFKHQSDARNSLKLRKVRRKFGAEGYAIYWFCLEAISYDVDKDNLTFELKEDAETIGFELDIQERRVEEIMIYMISIGLFEQGENCVTCFNLAESIDKSMTNSPKMRKWLELKGTESVMTSHDSVSTCAELELEKKRTRKEDLSNMSESDDSNPQVTQEVKQKKPRLTVPYAEIESLYKEILVDTGESMSLVNIQLMTDERKRRVKQYWVANGNKGLAGVRSYFEYLWNNRQSHSWLFGTGNRAWRADIEFIMREKTVAKARENTLGNWSNDQ